MPTTLLWDGGDIRSTHRGMPAEIAAQPKILAD
jgi:hypothetical protein